MNLDTRPAAVCHDIAWLHRVWGMMTAAVSAMMLADEAQRCGDDARRERLIQTALQATREIVEFVTHGTPGIDAIARGPGAV